MTQKKGKAAKMKAEPKRRRLTREQRRWLKLLEFVPQAYVQDLLERALPVMVHGQRLGYKVLCLPEGFVLHLLTTNEDDKFAEARRKFVCSIASESRIPAVIFTGSW